MKLVKPQKATRMETLVKVDTAVLKADDSESPDISDTKSL